MGHETEIAGVLVHSEMSISRFGHFLIAPPVAWNLKIECWAPMSVRISMKALFGCATGTVR